MDVIDAEGNITPVMVSKVETEQINSAPDGKNYLLRVELSGRDTLEWIYLDEYARISKRLVARLDSANNTPAPDKLQYIYTLERSKPEDILRQFPERAEYILQKNETLNQP